MANIGGIGDWKKAGGALVSIHPLPEGKPRFIDAGELRQRIEGAQQSRCVDQQGLPLLTVLDMRNALFLDSDSPLPRIATECPTITMALDDLRDPALRATIPLDGLVVTVTETGNRDVFVMRYLSGFGYNNIQGLQFGMRGWIKLGYPTEKTP